MHRVTNRWTIHAQLQKTSDKTLSAAAELANFRARFREDLIDSNESDIEVVNLLMKGIEDNLKFISNYIDTYLNIKYKEQ